MTAYFLSLKLLLLFNEVVSDCFIIVHEFLGLQAGFDINLEPEGHLLRIYWSGPVGQVQLVRSS